MEKRVYYGLFVIFLGLICLTFSIFLTPFLLIYAIPLLIIGLVISFNKKEDSIEEIIYKGSKKPK